MPSARTAPSRFGAQAISNWDLLAANPYGDDYPARVYHVNNITGLSTNDGLSWEFPMDQVSTAITAWTAYLAGRTSTDAYVRGRILVQGTGTAYTAITAWPSYCDLWGVGADPRGNGSGIARITGSTSAAAAGSARGLHLKNMQFIGSGSYYAATFSVLFRSILDNCTFVNGATGGLDITSGGGIQIIHCQMGGGDTVNSVTGLRVGSAGGNFNNCVVQDCVISGTTTGVENTAYLANATVFKDNFIYGGSKGVDDNSTESNILGNAWYVNNFVYSGTDAFEMTNNGTKRVIGNWINENGTAKIEVSVTDITT